MQDDPGVRTASFRRRRDYLTVSEVAELFHVSSKTIVRWANDGKLPHMATLGGHRRFPRDQIEEMIASRRRDARHPSGGHGSTSR